MSRISNSIRNSSYAFVAQILGILLGFITRTVFIYTLGASYLGINGLFINILSVLSLAELGIGTAIVYALYKPLADGNEKKVSALMNFYGNAYKAIGIFIAIIGLSITPFLEYIIKDSYNISNLTVIYLLFLSNSVISYFYTYKRSIIIASQQGHINTINQMKFLVLQNISQIIILLIYDNYLVFLLIQIAFTVASNIEISFKANKLFPFLKKNKKLKLDLLSRNEIKKNVFGTVFHKLGGVVVTGTDNILISIFSGIYWVGVYSNYILLVGTVQTVIMQVINSVTASVGNLTALEDNYKSHSIFKKLFFINYVFTTFAVTFFIVLLNPFITVWIGPEYTFEENIVILVILNFAISQMRQPAITFINTYGLFWQIRWKSLYEAVFNLAFSLFFLIQLNMGITGVLLATTLSSILTNFWWEPYTTFKYGFKIPLRSYFIMYIKYACITFFIVYIASSLSNYVLIGGWLAIFEKFLICLIVPMPILLLFFYRTEEFIYTVNIIKKALKK